MRLLLINTNRATQPYPVMPIGLASVATALSRDGHEVRMLDLCFSEDPHAAIEQAIDGLRPELAALSVRNLDNSDLLKFEWFLPEIREMVRTVRRCTDVPVIIGGSAVSVMPVAVLEYLGCDLGVIGDGEQVIIELVRKLAADDPTVAQTPGVVMRYQGAWIVNPKQPVQEYNLFGTTQLHRWIDVNTYVRHGSIFPIQSNRGCAFSCIYCTYTQIEGKRYRLRPVELVVQDLRETYEAAGIDYFEFVDSVFNVPESHAKDICRGIIEARLPLRFGAAGVNPRWLTDGLLRLMEQAGFASLDVTIESASETMLRAMRKGFRREDVLMAAARVRQTPIKILWVLLLGGPGETLQTLDESFRFVRERVRPNDVVYITSGIRIYPETPMALTAMEEGIVRNPEELIRPTFYLSGELGIDEMRDRVLQLARECPNVIASFAADDPLIPLAYRWFHRLGVAQPYWRYAPLLNRLKSRRAQWNHWMRMAGIVGAEENRLRSERLPLLASSGSYYFQHVLA